MTTPNPRTQLASAKAAYHSLVTGGMARVVVDQNGERVEFFAANKGELAAYIRELELAVQGCGAPTNHASHFPATFTF